jgi:tryptophan-rich sensory protein
MAAWVTFQLLKYLKEYPMQLRTLVPTALAVTATGVVGGLASRPAQSSWFHKLKKPSYQPPSLAFPIAWNVLYADIAATSAATLDQLEGTSRQRQRRAYIAALASNLVLNASWSWLFFSQRRLGTAAIAAGVLTASSADLTRRSVAVQGAKAAPLAAYPAWCAFATVLSSHIWLLNRR